MFYSRIIARLDFRTRGNERIVNGSSRCSQFPPELVGGISSSYRDVAVFEVAIAWQKQRNNFYCTWDTIALYCDVRRIEWKETYPWLEMNLGVSVTLPIIETINDLSMMYLVSRYLLRHRMH